MWRREAEGGGVSDASLTSPAEVMPHLFRARGTQMLEEVFGQNKSVSAGVLGRFASYTSHWIHIICLEQTRVVRRACVVKCS